MRTVQKIKIILIILFIYLSQIIIAQDTIPVYKPVKPEFKPEPLKATMLAIAFPGMGQIYNRKYWKLPFVYAGFGALVYSISFNTKKYNEMMEAYQDFTDKIPETDSYIPLVKFADPPEYDPVLYPDDYDPANASWVKDNLLEAVDYYKRYRDLSYIGIAAWYLITILDANVDASLSNFEVTDKLNVDVSPMQLPVPGVVGTGINVRLTYTF